MRFERGYKSKNVEYRGRAGKKGLALGGGGLGIIGVIIALLLSGGGGGGIDFDDITAGAGSSDQTTSELPPENAFLEFVFDDVQFFWDDLFAASDADYPEARFVIFAQAVNTDGCGQASSAVGPFYCPADSQVYLDQEFLDELQRRFGAPGDFAQAYVIAHEVGHHVQNVTGISADVRARQQGANQADVNDLSVRLELQADCLAGVWANDAEARGLLERGDLEEGLGAAAAVGDDRINPGAGPESWTHGSADQRVEWFSVGFDTGNPQECDSV
ncbi:MAG: neutral zinc metallopeptidase [Acidimicrobiia bacterium]|nr:neutral zinc metallopeptidase [Acidimicrobiia bacterium]